MKYALLFALIILSIYSFYGQNTTWVEELGYSKSDKLLIIHGDDLGVAHSVNKASFEGFQKGLLNSASIMMPCPWFEEVRGFSFANPEYDLGLHLTLTSEWEIIKWRGLADKGKTQGLYNEDGYFYSDVAPVVTKASLAEVEMEIRAQIDKAIQSGMEPSHLDSHMGTLFSKKEFIALYMKLGQEYKIPVFLPAQIFLVYPELKDELTNQSVITNEVYMNNVHLEKDEVFEYYDSVITNLSPGLNELIVHLGFDNEELKATCINHPAFGAKWRQNDYEYVTSPHLKSLLKTNGVKLVTWKEIQAVIYK